MASPVVPIDLVRLRRSCGACALHELCLPAGIGSTDLERLDSAVRDRHALDSGETLFAQGDTFRALYVVRSGSLKSSVESSNGDMQVLGFHLPGEILGVDGLGDDRHQCRVEALEHSSICELPYKRLQELTTTVPALHRQLMRVVSREVVAEQGHMVMMGRQQAQERLAIFLRSLSERYGRLDRDREALTLTMSRHDIANYLGLVVETVSRLFSRMAAAGILEVNRKSVRVLRADLLEEMCGEQAEPSCRSRSQ